MIYIEILNLDLDHGQVGWRLRVLHGSSDDLIPSEMGRSLAQLSKEDCFSEISGGGSEIADVQAKSTGNRGFSWVFPVFFMKFHPRRRVSRG